MRRFSWDFIVDRAGRRVAALDLSWWKREQDAAAAS
jgi:hypothetical protein